MSETKRPTGYSWRVLAYGPGRSKPAIELYSPDMAAADAEMAIQNGFPPRDPPLAPDSKFDELVISPWLHLEELDDNAYWLQIGDYHLDVGVGADGKATVLIRWEGDGPAPEQPDVFRDNTGI